MPDPRAEIARTIARLDHPDAIHQDELLTLLTEREDVALGVALSSLGLLSPRVHRALLRWLGSRVDAHSALPLMRYVFDTSDVIEEQSGRTMAMAMLVRLIEVRAEDESALRGRARAFAEDLLDDRDPEVVDGALRILEHVGDGRSALKVEERRGKFEEHHPRTLRATLQALRDLPLAGGPQVSASEFRESLIESAGPRRRVLLREWRRREDRGEVARALVTRDEGPVNEALQILIASPQPAARASLGNHLDPGDAERFTLALQALAACAKPPALAGEVEAIRRALSHPDALARQAGAALAATLAPHDASIERALAGLLLESDLALSEAAAKALAHLPGAFDEATLGRVVRAADLGVQRLQRAEHQLAAMALAWTLRGAARRLPERDGSGVQKDHTELRAIAIVTLRLEGQRRALVVASLELLDRLSQLAREAWPDDQLGELVELAQSNEVKAASRAADILIRVAPVGLGGLDEAGANPQLDPLSRAIPLLKRSATDRAHEILGELTKNADPQTSEAAHDALAWLRRQRNESDYIEAHFVPRRPED